MNQPTSAPLNLQQLQSLSTQMKGSSPSASANATPSTSWDAFDKATGKTSSSPVFTDAFGRQTSSWGQNTPAAGIANTYNSFMTNSANAEGDALKNTASSVQTGANNFDEGLGKLSAVGNTPMQKLGDLGQSTGGILQGAVGATGGLVNTVISPITGAIKTASDALSNNPNVQKFSQNPIVSQILNGFSDLSGKLSNLSTAHPEAAQTIGNVLNTVLTAVGGNEDIPSLSGVKSDVSNAVDAVKGGASDLTKPNVPPGIKPVESTPKVTTPTVDENGVNPNVKGDSTPSYSKNLSPNIKDAQGNITPRVSEGGGVFKGREVTQTPSEIAGDRLLSNTPGYGGSTALEKFNSLQQPLSDNRLSFRDSLKNETDTSGSTPKVSPQKMVSVSSSAIKEATGEALSLAKQDPVVRNFINNLIKGSKQVETSPLGVHDLIEKMNNVYENAGGKYVGNKALDTVYRASNTSLKGLLNEVAPNSDVANYFKNQSLLHGSSEVLWQKAMSEGGSAFTRFVKEHPTLYNAGTGALKMAGLGAGLHFLP